MIRNKYFYIQENILRQALIKKRKILNIIHSFIIIVGTGLMLSLAGFLIFGLYGVLFVSFIWLNTILLVPLLQPDVLTRLYHAKQISYHELPKLYDMVNRLSKKASLDQCPELYYIPSNEMIIFSTSLRSNAAIAISDGMFRLLNYDEMYGVLAHEISHIKNKDLWLMQLTDVAGRLASFAAYLGQVLIILLLPFLLENIIFLLMLFMIFLSIPPLTKLMQLSLSRLREYGADLDSVLLTGSPEYLISALYKLDRIEASVLHQLFNPFLKHPEPSLLRTHPPTENRIRKLQELQEESPNTKESFDVDTEFFEKTPTIIIKPKRRFDKGY